MDGHGPRFLGIAQKKSRIEYKISIRDSPVYPQK